MRAELDRIGRRAHRLRPIDCKPRDICSHHRALKGQAVTKSGGSRLMIRGGFSRRNLPAASA
jgi:hypothetical protein